MAYILGDAKGRVAMNDSHNAADATNRLSIAHLLLWMATTSAVLAFLQEFVGPLHPRGDFEPQFLLFHQVMGIVSRSMAPAYGAALAGGVLAIWRAMTQRRGFPTHPGHWLLLAVSVSTVAIASVVCIGELLQGPDSVQGVVLAALMLATATVAGIGALRGTRQGTKLWIVPLLALSVFAGAVAALGIVRACTDPTSPPLPLFDLPLFVLTIGALIAAEVTIFIAACIDLRRRLRRDVFHWAGVVFAMLIIAHPLAESLAKRLILP